jgi:localization factor PodJL
MVAPLTVPSSGPLTAQTVPPAVGPNEDLLGQAEAGDAAAQFKLAVHYAEGGAGPRNYEQAAQWYEKAAQQGLAVAEYRLGSLYEKGLGVGKDMQRAKDLYQRAAEKGNIRAMHNLGVLAAEDGKPNYTSAALWFGKAAEYGIRDSQYNLAVLLARGLGLPKDLVKSYTWFAIVAATGDADAARKRDDVAAMLTSSELAAANAAAAGFAPRRADHPANEILPPAQPERPLPRNNNWSSRRFPDFDIVRVSGGVFPNHANTQKLDRDLLPFERIMVGTSQTKMFRDRCADGILSALRAS